MSALGTVYGVILNVHQELERLGDALTRAPYVKPPEAPVLFIKPPNTLLPGGGSVPAPADVDVLQLGATLAVLIGVPACRVPEAQALHHVAGYAAAIDVCIPHPSLHRPPIRQRCRDGFLPIGRWQAPAHSFDPDNTDIAIEVNGQEELGWSTADLVRSVAKLLADVTAFMTLSAGDVLLVGLPPDPPLARVGDLVTARVAGVGEVRCRLVPELAA